MPLPLSTTSLARAALLTAALGGGCPAPQETTEAPAATIAVRDVTVIPMTGGPALEHRTVFIDGDRISDISPADVAIPDGTTIIDGASRYLVPGLIDTHVHLRRADAPRYVADGVLTVRNMWGHSGIRPLIDEIGRGGLVGPATLSLSPGVDGSPPQWPETEILDDPAGAEAIVDRLVRAGWRTIKVYQRLSVASFDAVAAAAKRHGVAFAGHVPTAVPIEHALASGMYSIEHLNGYDRHFSATRNTGTWGWGDANLQDGAALASETARRGTWNVPTLAIYALLAKQHPPEMRDRVIANRRRFVRMLADAGAPLAAGTDAGIDVIPVAGSLLAELRQFEAAGLSPTRALMAATRDAGKLLGIAHLGTIAVGAPARLLLLDADPTKDLAALRQPRAAILDGRVFAPDARCFSLTTESASMTSTPLRLTGAALTLVALACGGEATETPSSVAGTYDTQVSIVSSDCPLPIQNNPTVVQQSAGSSIVTLTHAGTTYGGELRGDLTFTTQSKTVTVGGVSYQIVVSGGFAGGTLDANVTLDYGTAPACHVVVHWQGPKQP